nr:MAG TPA: hypothetical protein [Caudoviricetes sp.]
MVINPVRGNRRESGGINPPSCLKSYQKYMKMSTVLDIIVIVSGSVAFAAGYGNSFLAVATVCAVANLILKIGGTEK